VPYRTTIAPEPPADPPPGGSDDRVILWVGLVVGAVACVPQVLSGVKWGAQPTIGLLVMLTCTGLLTRDYLSLLRRRLRARRAARSVRRDHSR